MAEQQTTSSEGAKARESYMILAPQLAHLTPEQIRDLQRLVNDDLARRRSCKYCNVPMFDANGGRGSTEADWRHEGGAALCKINGEPREAYRG